jgi:hypothetical protein
MTDITILPFSFPAVARKIVTADFDGGRYNIAHGRRHKKLTDWARQAILQVRRWLPEHMIVVVADSSFAALDLIAAVRRHVCLVTRLRLDASLFEPPPKRHASQKGRPPKKGRRLPKLSQRLEDKKTHWTDCRCHIGMAMNDASSRSRPERRSGITPDCRRRRSAGCSCAIPPTSAIRRHFSAQISMRRPTLFSDGS